jgi:hypothetical protein
MKMRMLLFGVGATLIVGGGAASASAHNARTPSAAGERAVAGRLYVSGRAGGIVNQNNNSAFVAVLSQNFEPALDTWDTRVADDFTVPAAHKWAIRTVVVTGRFTRSNPVVSENVTFYKGSSGQPGAVVNDQTVVGTQSDGLGSFLIRLPAKVALKQGTYWISVQANMDYVSSGKWSWMTRNTQKGGGAEFQNPGDAWETGCTTWGAFSTCFPSGVGPDMMFQLKGLDTVL